MKKYFYNCPNCKQKVEANHLRGFTKYYLIAVLCLPVLPLSLGIFSVAKYIILGDTVLSASMNSILHTASRIFAFLVVVVFIWFMLSEPWNPACPFCLKPLHRNNRVRK